MAVKHTIRYMHETARLKGGQCLSTHFTDNDTSLKWMCQKGHTWDAPYSIIQQGGWCMRCSQKEHYFNALKSVVEKKGGKCLSEEYINSTTPLQFQCVKGHIWKAPPQNIKFGYWCRECAGSKKLTLEHFRKIAEDKGGKCLSTTYKNKDTHLKFQCARNHTWLASPRNINNGTWCPNCPRFNKQPTDKIRAGLKKIKKNYLLEVTQITGNLPPRKDTIELMSRYAEFRNGKCLSKRYVSSGDKLNWQCQKGHIWRAAPELIVAGNWCPECSGNVKGSIAQMKAIAEAKKGKCLSKIYINQNSKLKWRCEFNHEWESTPSHVVRGSWCPYCANNLENTLSRVKESAKQKGGRCLSSKYENRHAKLKWECAKKHIWETSYGHILKGSWCPVCAQPQRWITRKAN